MCLEVAAAKEASEFQASQISENENMTYAIRNHKNSFKRSQQTSMKSFQQTCSRCGQKNHSARECRCSRSITCFKCQRIGHYASMCRSVAKSKPAQPKFPRKRNMQVPVNQISEESIVTNEEQAQSSSEEYTFAVDNQEK